MFLFALLACETGSVVLDDSGGLTETDTDTDADSDTDTDADSDTDTDTDTDTDPMAQMEGDYEGYVEGANESDWDTYECSGEIVLEVDADGLFTGEADCDAGYFSYWGEIEGEISADGDNIDTGSETYRAPSDQYKMPRCFSMRAAVVTLFVRITEEEVPDSAPGLTRK